MLHHLDFVLQKGDECSLLTEKLVILGFSHGETKFSFGLATIDIGHGIGKSSINHV